MNKYRDRLQIIADMLYTARNGAKKTQIMYKANLSYRLLGRYLHEVLDAGLVKSEKGNSYVLTTKGETFLNRHIEYSELRKSLEKNLESINSEKTILERLCGIANGFNNNLRSFNKNEELKRPM
ncbi:MAG TPA: winged helix-turn-helix domain-containing protein [Candidatus Bathyarchaeia archaeon]